MGKKGSPAFLTVYAMTTKATVVYGIHFFFKHCPYPPLIRADRVLINRERSDVWSGPKGVLGQVLIKPCGRLLLSTRQTSIARIRLIARWHLGGNHTLVPSLQTVGSSPFGRRRSVPIELSHYGVHST